jgi:hypothetical protein
LGAYLGTLALTPLQKLEYKPGDARTTSDLLLHLISYRDKGIMLFHYLMRLQLKVAPLRFPRRARLSARFLKYPLFFPAV